MNHHLTLVSLDLGHMDTHTRALNDCLHVKPMNINKKSGRQARFNHCSSIRRTSRISLRSGHSKFLKFLKLEPYK